MREMKIITVELLKNFDIELISPQSELERESLTIFLTRAKHDIRVRLIPRKLPTMPGDKSQTKYNGGDGNADKRLIESEEVDDVEMLSSGSDDDVTKKSIE